ncbi:MAG: DNA-3-methyladenine glycosylase I [Acidimicrobiales bacterium]
MVNWGSIGVVEGSDGLVRCGWAVASPEYVAYHDTEWGVPVTDDRALYEKICLDGFQSGLSWITILRKRANFQRAFAGFDPDLVAGFGPTEVERLLGDAGIVRHRGKIEATIANARAMVTVADRHGSLASLMWSFEPAEEAGGAPNRDRDPDSAAGGDDPVGSRPAPTNVGDLPASTPESTALSKTLRAVGFRFVGPTTIYAMMQAVGLVNDHLVGCHRRSKCHRLRRELVRPVVVGG